MHTLIFSVFLTEKTEFYAAGSRWSQSLNPKQTVSFQQQKSLQQEINLHIFSQKIMTQIWHSFLHPPEQERLKHSLQK